MQQGAVSAGRKPAAPRSSPNNAQNRRTSADRMRREMTEIPHMQLVCLSNGPHFVLKLSCNDSFGCTSLRPGELVRRCTSAAHQASYAARAHEASHTQLQLITTQPTRYTLCSTPSALLCALLQLVRTSLTA